MLNKSLNCRDHRFPQPLYIQPPPCKPLRTSERRELSQPTCSVAAAEATASAPSWLMLLPSNHSGSRYSGIVRLLADRWRRLTSREFLLNTKHIKGKVNYSGRSCLCLWACIFGEGCVEINLCYINMARSLFLTRGIDKLIYMFDISVSNRNNT